MEKQLNSYQKGRYSLRRITELKGRADLALWFLESHGLKLTCLKVRESDSRREHTFDFVKEKVTQEDQENLEQLLFLLDKFWVSDEPYHELIQWLAKVMFNQTVEIWSQQTFPHWKRPRKVPRSTDIIYRYTPGSHKGIFPVTPRPSTGRACKGHNKWLWSQDVPNNQFYDFVLFPFTSWGQGDVL